MVLIRIAHAADLPTLDEALKTLEGMPSAPAGEPSSPRRQPAPTGGPSGGNGAAIATQRMPAGSGGGQAMRLVEAPVVQEPALSDPSPSPMVEEAAATVPVAALADIAALAERHRDMAFKVRLKSCVRLVRIDDGRLEISLTPDAPKTLISELNANLQRWTGRRWVVSVSREEGGRTLAEEEASRRETAFSDAASDPAVAAIMARFPGAKIIDVRIPDATAADDDQLPAETTGDEDES